MSFMRLGGGPALSGGLDGGGAFRRTLRLNLMAETLDPRVTYTRTGTTTYVTGAGIIRDAAADVAPVTHYFDAAIGKFVSAGRQAFAAITSILPHTSATNVGWFVTGSGATIDDLSMDAMGWFPGLRVTSGGTFWHRAVSGFTEVLTAGEIYSFRAIYAAGTSGRAFVNVQDTTVGAGIAELSGPVGDLAIDVQTIGAVQIEAQGLLAPDIYYVDFTVVPNVTSSAFRSVSIGPGSDTAGEDVIALGMCAYPLPAFGPWLHSAGVAASRDADVYTVDVGDWFNGTEGTFIVDFFAGGQMPESRWIEMSDGSASNRLMIRFDGAAVVAGSVVGGVAQDDAGSGVNPVHFQNYRVAARFAAGNFGISINGAAVATSAAAMPAGLTMLSIGGDHAGSNQPNCRISRVEYIPAALDDAALASLSSL